MNRLYIEYSNHEITLDTILPDIIFRILFLNFSILRLNENILIRFLL